MGLGSGREDNKYSSRNGVDILGQVRVEGLQRKIVMVVEL